MIDVVILIYCCIAGQIESIGLISNYEHKSSPSFGSIHKSKGKQFFDDFGIFPGKNIFIGPNVSFLVRMGALYPPVSLLILLLLIHRYQLSNVARLFIYNLMKRSIIIFCVCCTTLLWFPCLNWYEGKNKQHETLIH